MDTKRPNIIFIFSDQHNSSVIGAAGDTVAVTPNLDSLAEKGTMLSDCYCASPLCVPSRSCMLTGQLPTQTGIYNNHQSLRFEQATFAHSLTASGYSTVLCGRMHFIGDEQRHGFQERLVGDFTPTHERMGGKFLGSLTGSTGPSIVSIEKSGPGYSSALAYDEDVVNAACSYVEGYESEQPLFMTVGLHDPHCPYVCPEELFEYYIDKVTADDDLEFERRKAHPAVKKWFELRSVENVTKEEVIRVKAAYYGMVTFMDSLIGRLLDTVDNKLDPDNTLIIYSSDHGDCIGDNGLFWKTNFYEGSVKVPLIFKYPKLFAQNRKISAPTSLTDLAPTLCDIAGAQMLPDTFGRSLLPLLSGEEEEDFGRVIISQLADIKGDAPSAMIKKDGYKLVKHMRYDDVQLFDLSKDPKEKSDLGRDRRYESVRQALLKILEEYWDEEEVRKTYEQDAADREIFYGAVEKCEYDSKYNWPGRPEQNYILDREVD